MNQSLTRFVLVFAALSLATATALGAIASHALDADVAGTFATGVNYQFVHSLGLLALATYAEGHEEQRSLALAALLLVTGIVLFCGGIYASSLTGPQFIARLAPVGGISLIGGWLVAAWGLFGARLSR